LIAKVKTIHQYSAKISALNIFSNLFAMIIVTRVDKQSDLEKAFQIRRIVFVDEQQVSAEDEFDEYEDSSHHFLATYGGEPCGAARWRYTDKGIKLERFAVLEQSRGKGVGAALVEAVLDHIAEQPESAGKVRYLHAQLQAMPLYARFGFQQVGDIFSECNILHYKMQLV
jgi:predicted GNAT family N-acyltransferase